MTKKQAKETTSSDDEAYHKEMDKAAVRIGTDNAAAMNWLIRFAYTDLEAISQGEFLNLEYELNCFVDRHFRTLLLPSLSTGFTLTDWREHDRFPDGIPVLPLIAEVGTPEFRPPTMDFPSLETIKDLQTLLAAPLNQLLQEKRFSLWLPRAFLTITTFPPSDIYGGQTIANTPEESFKYNVAVLLTEASARIRRCPECHRVFVADRKNKFSCSTRCQNTAAVRRMRQGLPKRTGKPGRPPGTTRKKTGEKGKATQSTGKKQ